MEYDGTDFRGYQLQGQGERTVQSELMRALLRLTPQEQTIIHAAGRTDTGVHALGQIVSFQTQSTVPIERFAIAMNSHLPPDIAVAAAEEVADNFHARFSAKSRTYGYLLWTRRSRSAVWGRYSLHVRSALNVVAMRAAAQHLIGTHDFAAYGKAGDVVSPTVRRVDRLDIRRVGAERILIVVTATGFLRSMVRNMVGMLLEVGKGDAEPGVAWNVLQTGHRSENPFAPAAPQGLFLWRVGY